MTPARTRRAVATETALQGPIGERRHDLDGLRAMAMLLGIVLHAALSFAAIPWPVQDARQNEAFHWLFASIHGFRMPLFFMLSGFFTAMLWRRRGLVGLVKQRFRRIFLPLVLGCLSIVPAMWMVSYLVSQPSAPQRGETTLFAAVVAGDLEALRAQLQSVDVDVNAVDAGSGSSPLCTAVFLGRTEMVALLLEAGASVNQANRDQATPLHIAAFMGRSQEAALLLDAGADVQARDGGGRTPREVLKTDFGTTSFVASSLGVQVEQQSLAAGRNRIAEALGATETWAASASTESASDLEGLWALLFLFPVFMHLWFLWFLCWYVAAFLPYAWGVRFVSLKRVPRWLFLSPLSLLWLVPLTMLPQWWMEAGTFGPDPSIGLLPLPYVLFYYAIFFFFGAIYWDLEDRETALGRWWQVSLPVAICVVFPVGFDCVTGRLGIVPGIASEPSKALVGSFLQAVFAWLMVFGCVGACRRFLVHENRVFRYLSDASYWLYLAHLPLVILAQWLVRDWPLPAAVKFLGITLGVSGVLLVSYAYGVRYTFIGRLLNGPRLRPREMAGLG